MAQGREEGKRAVDRPKREPVACRLHVSLPLRDSEVQEIRMSSIFVSFVVMAMQNPPLRDWTRPSA